MRFSIVAALAAVLCLGYVARAEDKKDDASSKDVKVTGVLIDQHCGEEQAKKDDAQKSAAAHKKGCTLKCGKDGGYAIMSEGKLTNLSADSKDKVEEYLKKDENKTEATVTGTKAEDGTITVTSIAAAEEKKS
ncbi:MAG TPA: hypothetical protein VF669_12280 [Tepidisphaeraceae bacterium]|jgi:hypothetical protein